jgi:hypothetical protein
MNEQRRDARVRSFSRASVRWPDGRIEGIVILNLSRGGAQLLSRRHDTDAPTVELRFSDLENWLPMEVLSRESRENGSVLRAAFGMLAPEDRDAVDAVVDGWSE